MIRAFVAVAAAALLWPATAAVAQSGAETGAAPPGAAECVARLNAEAAARGTSVGNDGAARLEEVCADVARAIEAGDWSGTLPEPGAGGLTADAFEDLLELMEHYAEPADGVPPLAVADLAAIAESLAPFEPPPELSLWQQITRWLEARLGLDRAVDGNRFVEWLRGISLPAEWARVIVYVLGVLVVGGAVAVALNELRLAGVFRGGPGRRRRRTGGDAGGRRGRPAPGLAALRDAPPARRPALLLAMILRRLAERGGAGASPGVRASMTHRELADAAAGIGVPRRTDFDAVVAAAERVTFSDWSPRSEDIDAVVERGVAVLDALDGDRDGRT